MGPNRAQRRLVNKKKKKPPQRRTILEIAQHEVEKEFEKHKKEIQVDTIRQSVHDLTAAFLISIHDELGLGTDEILSLLRRVNGNFESILENRVTIEDIKSWCEENGLNYNAIFSE